MRAREGARFPIPMNELGILHVLREKSSTTAIRIRVSRIYVHVYTYKLRCI